MDAAEVRPCDDDDDDESVVDPWHADASACTMGVAVGTWSSTSVVVVEDGADDADDGGGDGAQNECQEEEEDVHDGMRGADDKGSAHAVDQACVNASVASGVSMVEDVTEES